jgi:hypothetical protein
MGCKAVEWVSARVTSLLVTGMLAAAVAATATTASRRTMDHDGANSLAPSGWPERRRQATGLNVGRAIIEFSDVGVRWSGGPVGIPIRR